MSDRENNESPEYEPQDDGVALSPYDSDLRPADDEPVTGDLDLRTPDGYDEADEELSAEAPAEPSTQQLAEESDVVADEGSVDDLTDDVEETRAVPLEDAGTEPATAAMPVAPARSDDDLEDDPLSDTAVRRTSLIRPQVDEMPSNEPVALRESTEADPRVDNYGTAYDDSDLFEGAQYDKVPGRAGAHILSVLAFLLMLPVGWYLVADAGARMTLPENAQWTTGTMSIAPFGELIAGLIVFIAAWWAARSSSVGAWVVGTLLALFGGMFVVVPGVAKDLVSGWETPLRNFHDGLGGNIYHHLVADGSTGRLLVLGVLVMLTGLVARSARRKGAEEQRIREAVERRKARLDANG